MTKKVRIKTLGCRLNQADEALILDTLVNRGYEVAGTVEEADLLVVNSCVVTSEAGQKSRSVLRQFRRNNPTAFIVLTGCGATAEKMSEYDLPVDLVLDNLIKVDLVKYLPEELVRPESTLYVVQEEQGEDSFKLEATGYYPNSTRANLKIQEGCNFFCSYCIVPFGRGKPRSRDFDDVLREARMLIDNGHKELVIAGVNVATYRNQGKGLAGLVQAITELDGDFRVRLSSTEPRAITEDVIELVRDNPKVCNFLHLPMQYGENTILEKMNRRYSVEEFSKITLKAAEIPNISIGTDIIVGFPGETDEVFAKCVETVKALPFSYLHVFTYSPRKGTPAAELKAQVNGAVAKARYKIIQEINEEKMRVYAEANRGKCARVLLEKVGDESVGWTGNYLKAHVAEELLENSFVDVAIGERLKGRDVTATRC